MTDQDENTDTLQHHKQKLAKKKKKQNTNVSTSEREVYHWGGVFVLASADGRVLYSGPESWKYR